MSDPLCQLGVFVAIHQRYRKERAATQLASAAIFRTVRRRLGLTQRTMAQLLKIQPTYLCKIECGNAPAGDELFDRLYGVNGVNERNQC